MSNLRDKTVFISGASSGIGLACAEKFAEAGARLILCARNLEQLNSAADSIRKKNNTEIFTFKLDVRERADVVKSISELPEHWKRINILINNAGLALGLDKLQHGNMDDWDTMIDTNIKGLLYLTRQIVPLMIDFELEGHVVNIGSSAGLHAYPDGAVYCATKAAVKFISDGLRMDVVDKPIRVTNIQPGMTETNFSLVRFKGDKTKSDNVYKGIDPLTPEDIAGIVLFTASVPAHVQICEVTVTPVSQATGRVIYRKP